MGNGQSSPAGAHPHPQPPKQSTSHREHHRRSPSPGQQQQQPTELTSQTLLTQQQQQHGRARKKSLELPDLARLNFTAANGPASGRPGRADGATGRNGSPTKSSGGGAGAGGRAGTLGRKRPSPLAPNLMTSPLSAISPQPTPAHVQATSHNPYFPPTTAGGATPAVSAEASPIDIPNTPQGVASPALPAYDRMTYSAEPPSRRMSEAVPPAAAAAATFAPARPSSRPQPRLPATTTTLNDPPPSTATAPKKARIADEPPLVLPPVPSASSSISPPSNARQHQHKHKPKQPSVSGADEDNTIRSSLPSGGDEYPPGTVPPPRTPPASASVSAATVGEGSGRGEGMLGLSISGNGGSGTKSGQREEVVNVEGQEEGVPTIINWTGGGKEVYVCGTFAKNWKERLKMSKSTHDFTLVLNLPPGPHRLKFIVDETWRCSDDLANATDADGSLVNYIEVEPKRKDGDGPGWSSEWDAHLGVDSDDDSQWTTEIPEALVQAQALEEQHLNKIANLPPANRQPGSAALNNPLGLPHPPGLPRHLEKVILNNPSKDAGTSAGAGSGAAAAAAGAGTDKVTPAPGACWTATPDDNSILPIPNHVVLNHLTASAIRNGVLAVGTTTRYKRKYISTLLYKPVEL